MRRSSMVSVAHRPSQPVPLAPSVLPVDSVLTIPDLLLSVEPDNMQAQSLRTLIDRAVTRDGYIGACGKPSPGLVLTEQAWASSRALQP